jgi:glycerate-2-kinase
VGDPLDMIASGPTFISKPDKDEVNIVINKYKLLSKIPESIRSFLEEEYNSNKNESDFDRDRIVNFLVANNEIALKAAIDKAQQFGFQTKILTSLLTGEASEKGKEAGELLRKAKIDEGRKNRKFLYVLGGETTVTLSQDSKKGGRNQEYVLSSIKTISDLQNICIISIASDGEDGPTDAAGAIADGNTLKLGMEKGMDPDIYLNNHNSYAFFKKLNALIKTGPTGTNINDLVFLIGY